MPESRQKRSSHQPPGGAAALWMISRTFKSILATANPDAEGQDTRMTQTRRNSFRRYIQYNSPHMITNTNAPLMMGS